VRTNWEADAIDARHFSKQRLATINETKMLGIRSGSDHRFTWVWVVVVGERVFLRSWNDLPTGWFRAFQNEPRGAMTIADREVPIRARRVRGERLRKAIEGAYAAKYTTKASLRYVRGFKTARRRKATVEIMPR
jgi:hypothetical protein